jgi:hypothetical protein
MKTATEKNLTSVINIDNLKYTALGINKTKQKTDTPIQSETDLWLDYLNDLDPEDETGAFLTPGDLNAIEHAYLRLQTDDSGGTDKPKGRKSLASNADDEFIKHKIGLALQRAIPQRLTLLEETKTNPEDIDLALTMLDAEQNDIRFRVLDYQKGYLTGQVKVLFPKSKPRKRTFCKEKGWRATIEIVHNRTQEYRTVYTRGLCMNVLHNGVGEDIANQILGNAKVENSGITFEPVLQHHHQGEWKPDAFSMNFVKPGWKIIKPKAAQKLFLTQKISAFSSTLGILHAILTKSYNFIRWK